MLVKLTVPTRLSINLNNKEIEQVTEYAIENDITFQQALVDMLSMPTEYGNNLDIDTLDAIVERVYWADTNYPTEHALPQFGCNKQIVHHIDIATQLHKLLSLIPWREHCHYESINDFVNVVIEQADWYGFCIEETDKDFAKGYIASVADKYM